MKSETLETKVIHKSQCVIQLIHSAEVSPDAQRIHEQLNECIKKSEVLKEEAAKSKTDAQNISMKVRDEKQKLEDQKSRLELIKSELRQGENFNSMKSELAHNLVQHEKDEK